MLFPVTNEEKLFSLSTRDWLNKAFLASGIGSGLPTRPGSTAGNILGWESTKHNPHHQSAFPEVIGLPYKMGRKTGYATGAAGEGVVGGAKSLPQRLRDSFNDGSLNLPEQCLWNMEIQGNCHDSSFTLKSVLSGKALAHPNMAGEDDVAFAGTASTLEQSMTVNFDAEMRSIYDDVGADGTCANIDSPQAKCAALHGGHMYLCPKACASTTPKATYCKDNTAALETFVRVGYGTPGFTCPRALASGLCTSWAKTFCPETCSSMPAFCAEGTKPKPHHVGLVLSRGSSTPLTFASGRSDDNARWTGTPACRGNQDIGSSQRKNCLPEHKCGQCSSGYTDCNTDCAAPTTPFGIPGPGSDVCHRAPELQVSTSTLPNAGKYAMVQVALQQHKKDSVTPQLFNVTLTYLRQGALSPVTRSHLLAYEAGASIALEQIKGVPCSGPIILTATACVEAADSRVNCDFPATRKTLSNPCHAENAAEEAAAAPLLAHGPAAPVRPAAASGESLALPTHPAAATTTAAPAAQAAATPLAPEEADADRPRPHLHHHFSHPMEVVIGLSLVLLLSTSCFVLVRRSFRPSLRSEELLDQEGVGGIRYDKRPAVSKV